MAGMFCGCSKQKPPPRVIIPDTDDSGYGLLSDIPEYNGQMSESWFPTNLRHETSPRKHHPSTHHYETCPQPPYTRCQHHACDSGIDTGSSPGSGHSNTTFYTGYQAPPSHQPIKVLDPYGSQPRLEISERGSSMDLSRKMGKLYQNYKGQIKLSVYLNSGLLTLHVCHAKHLASKWSELPCPYVKVSLYPSGGVKTRCKTATQLDNDRPDFDEKFSFELSEDDFSRRLLISVWSKDPNHNHSELLGCMSFGIQNIINGKTKVHGWYFLLSEGIGRRKHLQAHNKKHLVVNTDDWTCHLTDTSVSEFSLGPHADIAPHSSVLYMHRGDEGYGFTLSGGCPSQVFTIENGSPADTAGMRVGDSVLRINGQDVSRSTTDTVARIIRFHNKVAIEVQSPLAPTPTPKLPPWHGGVRPQIPRQRAKPIYNSQILTPLSALDLEGTSGTCNSHPRHS